LSQGGVKGVGRWGKGARVWGREIKGIVGRGAREVETLVLGGPICKGVNSGGGPWGP